MILINCSYFFYMGFFNCLINIGKDKIVVKVNIIIDCFFYMLCL